MEGKTKKAFAWIVGILELKKIPFQITAGLAARVYGSSREIYDIDIDVPENAISHIADEVKAYIIEGPYHHKGDNFDLILLTLNYHGQPIDICGGYEIKIKNRYSGHWEACPTDFSKSQKHNIFGIDVPVVSKEELVNYKTKVARPIDLDDVKQIS